MADLPLYLVEVREVENQHYRWFCTCGSKGIRLIYRQNVQALADKHYQQKHMPCRASNKESEAIMKGKTMESHTVISKGVFYKGVTDDLRSPLQNNKLVYKIGTTVEADSLDLDPNESCGHGINFCRTLADALRYGKTVVTLKVEGTIIDAGDKLRAKSVQVTGLANLSGANLPGANLSRANLSEANLFGANLSRANLSRAYLSEANLPGANLPGADLSRADLSRANLSEANLFGANLSRANLFGANLSRANLSGANLFGAYGLKLPAGWKLDASGLAVRT